jgi:phage-related protein
MKELFVVEIEPEVRLWLMNLPARDYAMAEYAATRLAGSPLGLGEPHSHRRGDGVRELRFDLGHRRETVRISYRIAPGRRIVLLTVFRKDRQREPSETARAERADLTCTTEHGRAREVFSRTPQEGNP